MFRCRSTYHKIPNLISHFWMTLSDNNDSAKIIFVWFRIFTMFVQLYHSLPLMALWWLIPFDTESLNYKTLNAHFLRLFIFLRWFIIELDFLFCYKWTLWCLFVLSFSWSLIFIPFNVTQYYKLAEYYSYWPIKQ